MREVETDAGGIKVSEGHLVDGERAGSGVEVLGGVDVCAGVIGHGDVVGGGAESGAAGGFGLMGVPRGHYEGRVEGVAEGAVLEGAGEVDYGGFLRCGGGMAIADRPWSQWTGA